MRVQTMKSIIRYFSSYNGINFIYVILAYTTLLIHSATSSPPSCGLYGAPPCRFLPAPPGQTPSCARPGKTYCEHIDNYPTYLIKHLVHKWGYEAKNLLIDETWHDFATVAWHDTPVFYDPAYIFNQHKNNNNAKGFSGYNYETPPYESRNGNANTNYNHNPYHYSKPSTTEGPTYLLYTSSTGQRLNFNPNKASAFTSDRAKSTPNNPTLWLKRLVRDLSKQPTMSHGGKTRLIIDTTDGTEEETSATRDVSLNMDLLDVLGVEKTTNSRSKRQSPGRSSLCQTTSQFIAPQAALNSKGNWMFVVNEASIARQSVKAELCASNTCSNLCQLPNGYNSRCEQKFVQKRLIALQGNGENLYTDSFWFPSCCVCTIAAN